jgi:hypothetical protein
VGDGRPKIWFINKDSMSFLICGLQHLFFFAIETLQVIETPTTPTRFTARSVHFCDEGASLLVCFLETHAM